MADIDIVPKGRSRTWLWILLAIVIVAIVWIALAANHRSNTVRNLAPPGGAIPAAVRIGAVA